MVCPPPPSDPPMLNEEMISGLIVPAPGWSECYSECLRNEKKNCRLAHDVTNIFSCRWRQICFSWSFIDPLDINWITNEFTYFTGRPGVSVKDMMYSPEHHDSVTSDQQLIESSRPKQSSRTSSFEIENLLKTAEQVTTYCRSPQETRKSSPTGSVTSSASNAVLTPSRQLTDAEKLRKVILELVDTERAYVKVIVAHFL